MDDEKCTVLSRRQLLSLGWVALLSPVIRQLPRSVVHMGGRGSWLSPLFALPLLLFYIWFLHAFLKNRSTGEGLQHQFCKALGRGGGRALLLCFSGWVIFYMGFVLRAGADRFIAAVYPNSRPTVFILILSLLGLMAGLGRLKVLSRCAEVVQPLLIFSLLLIVWSALPKIEKENLLPLTRSDLPAALTGALPVANTLCFTVYAAFLEHRVETGREGRCLLLPLMGTILLVFLLGLITVGCFGAELTGAMRHPFFVLIRDVRLFNLLERIEAVIIVQWVLTDFVLVALYCHVAASNLCFVFNGGEGLRRIFAVAVTGAAVAIAFFCAPTSFALQAMAEHLIPRLHFLFLFLLLPAVFAVGKIRRKI